jgi:hypothetical protein
MARASKQARQEYSEKLRDPRWQRMRTEVMQRTDFKCEDCGADDRTLNVHHSFYEWGLEPWDYPIESLHCLCEECHKRAQALYKCVKRSLGDISLSDTEILHGFMWGLRAAADPSVAIPCGSFEFCEGVGQAFYLSPEQVIDALDDNGFVDGCKLSELRGYVRLRQKAIAALPASLPAPKTTSEA